ncbi:excinuclease ABC subunit UvrC [Candidatus Methylacidiphilum infernorum]|uniref:Excinuclease ABC subunit UvrC n=1 Tax=Candidatus Methylacidiphilum infernorum TaxID=511746 RepID=A0ABX7PU71_9BACT|nr:excinuclease ABC subunit UvrC [Candidatus Methylacidiphilum infernorum]QSR86541.1 excinuclease ABC subunit UvrC [Candidatus Methylacidiphilum infernorum]
MSLQEKIRDLPHKPGVYLFKDRFNRVIYVGKAVDLHKRVSQYFHPSRRLRADRKLNALVEAAVDLEYYVVQSEAEAVLLEGRLIKEFRPRYNVSFRDDKRFLLVKVDLSEPFPRFQVTRLKKQDNARYFGPFASSSALRTTLNLMKKKFGLRSCTALIPSEKDYKHCLDHIIKNCSAPCIAKISQAEYLERVKMACAFLEGKSKEMIDEIRLKMEEAAQALDFEKAAELRNLLEALEETTRPARRFVKQLPKVSSPLEDLEELQAVLALPQVPHHIECFDISNISSTHKVASMVLFREGKADRSSYRRYRIKTVAGQDDFACMEEVIRRRYKRVLDEGGRLPDLIVVDGGKGQLSSALKALHSLQLNNLCVIGLAKENEEIYREALPDPLVLDKSSKALRLLQRIRDEAHRVANSYHQLLLKKRMRESILDDCPGISENRKMLLIRAFGSIEKIKKSSVEEIAAVKGIGKKLAEQILSFLSSRG